MYVQQFSNHKLLMMQVFNITRDIDSVAFGDHSCSRVIWKQGYVGQWEYAVNEPDAI